jgi:hypothetical protein
VFKEWFYQDEVEQCQEFLETFEEMVEAGNVCDDEGRTLKRDDSAAIAFLQS